MKYIILVIVMVISLLIPSPALADHETDVHFAAHFGVSYAVDTFFYGFNKKALRMDDTAAKVGAIITTLLIGIAYKASENASQHDMIRATGWNAVGAGAATMTQFMFNF